ncbi:hypothetical protein D3C73_1352400 [compost metagenome]
MAVSDIGQADGPGADRFLNMNERRMATNGPEASSHAKAKDICTKYGFCEYIFKKPRNTAGLTIHIIYSVTHLFIC